MASAEPAVFFLPMRGAFCCNGKLQENVISVLAAEHNRRGGFVHKKGNRELLPHSGKNMGPLQKKLIGGIESMELARKNDYFGDQLFSQ